MDGTVPSLGADSDTSGAGGKARHRSSYERQPKAGGARRVACLAPRGWKAHPLRAAASRRHRPLSAGTRTPRNFASSARQAGPSLGLAPGPSRTRDRGGIARFCPRGARCLSRLWHPSPRLSAPALRRLGPVAAVVFRQHITAMTIVRGYAYTGPVCREFVSLLEYYGKRSLVPEAKAVNVPRQVGAIHFGISWTTYAGQTPASGPSP